MRLLRIILDTTASSCARFCIISSCRYLVRLISGLGSVEYPSIHPRGDIFKWNCPGFNRILQMVLLKKRLLKARWISRGGCVREFAVMVFNGPFKGQHILQWSGDFEQTHTATWRCTDSKLTVYGQNPKHSVCTPRTARTFQPLPLGATMRPGRY